MPSRDTVAGRTAIEGQVVHLADLATDPSYGWTQAAALKEVRSIIGVPLLRDGMVVGTFSLTRNHVEPFTERQIEVIRTFADQAVIAIENTRLLNELRQRTDDLSESLEQQTATSEFIPIPNADAMRYSRDLAQKEGIFVGITAGATFAGALRVCAEAPKGVTVLCMLPDTGERYLSTPLFADIATDMNEEEIAISRSTPAAQIVA